MISEIEIKCVELVMASLLEACCPVLAVQQCFSTAGLRHQLHRVARGSPGIGHFSFLSIFY
jgi:hypothetical protein